MEFILRALVIALVCVICILSYIKLNTQKHIIKESYQNTNFMQHEIEYIDICLHNTKKYEKHKFECYKTAKKIDIKQSHSNSSKTIFKIKKGQIICFDFPQDILDSDLQIILKSIMQQWVLVAIIGDEFLLRGYLPLKSLRDKDNNIPKSENYISEASNKDCIKIKMPKITSKSFPDISGYATIENIVNIAKNKLYENNITEARAWLALAQYKDSNYMEIYELYTILLKKENNEVEANKIIQELNNLKYLKVQK